MECFHFLYSPLQITVKTDVANDRMYNWKPVLSYYNSWNVPDFGCSVASYELVKQKWVILKWKCLVCKGMIGMKARGEVERQWWGKGNLPLSFPSKQQKKFIPHIRYNKMLLLTHVIV